MFFNEIQKTILAFFYGITYKINKLIKKKHQNEHKSV